MNQTVRLPPAKRIGHSACPHDCPSTCALDVELLDERTIGRVHGSADNDYTVGVVCAKVARYAEREHHPQRVLHPLRRRGAKGSGEFERISWDAALDLVAENSFESNNDMAPKVSGHITMPAPWGWSCATVSIVCAM